MDVWEICSHSDKWRNAHIYRQRLVLSYADPRKLFIRNINMWRNSGQALKTTEEEQMVNMHSYVIGRPCYLRICRGMPDIFLRCSNIITSFAVNWDNSWEEVHCKNYAQPIEQFNGWRQNYVRRIRWYSKFRSENADCRRLLFIPVWNVGDHRNTV